MNYRSNAGLMVFAVALAVLAAACSDDSADSTTTTAAQTTTTAAQTTTTEFVQLTDASAIRGLSGKVVDGPNNRPSEIEFADDGTYRVKEFGLTIDTGVYTATTDTVTFVSSPSNDVTWFTNNAGLRTVTSCDDVVGEYIATFDTDNLLTLTVVWDDCPPRVTAANGLVLRLTS